MIFPVFIDASDLTSQFQGITIENIENLCDNIAKGLAAGYARRLEEEAQQALHQTRKRYIQNIRVIDSGRLEGLVLLDYSKDPMIRMIEEGASAWDMKGAFLNSDKVKYTKDGRKYLTIPFRFGTPGAVGESDVFTNILPEGIYKVVKNKATDQVSSGGGTQSQGLTIGEIPKDFQIPQYRNVITNQGNVLFEEYQHKNSLYEGLIKQKDSVTGQNTYHSFRRVTEAGIGKNGEKLGSDPNSWVHPGIEAHNLIDKALFNFQIEHETGLLLDQELSRLGFEV